jgi:hypothetical protein
LCRHFRHPANHFTAPKPGKYNNSCYIVFPFWHPRHRLHHVFLLIFSQYMSIATEFAFKNAQFTPGFVTKAAKPFLSLNLDNVLHPDFTRPGAQSGDPAPPEPPQQSARNPNHTNNLPPQKTTVGGRKLKAQI